MGIFDKLFGKNKSSEESVTQKNHQPKFVRKERKECAGREATYEIFKAKDAESAKAFLLTKRIDKELYYIIVETPEGNWGMDVEGLYLERLLSWQTNISSAECEGSIVPMSYSMFGLEMAAKGFNDNFIVKVQCGKCKHEWLDGVRYKNFTVVRCPKCKTLNKVDSNNIVVWLV